ncbi:NADH:ubiquinone reductase (Na(+)-transporting) subunit E [Paracoccus sp. S-4012]|uniref:NADH:ubiquinone reductase (Na(+)-transporting) subunit E n=1 Tax=Paracoccus sp. S-4012 TaxID=2665648 RepID=UPI0012AF84C7|nr:NADH:ubiquinone reductase (Na(+)-transporting) subunit E [Paracoccus sp. S-4012]MRX49481.1 NADH:ubiquinone reductase (Na(+)-transporting) subunit E [Paracoccus sp. S-4012]
MNDLGALFMRAALAENMPLTFFLGLCTFLALSRRPGTALGLGVAMIVVLGVATPLNHIVYRALLAPGAWAWAGLREVDLSYLSLLVFIGIIAALVQLLEMLMDRFMPGLHAAFGVFLPLLAIQCAIIAGSLFMVERRYNLAESAVFGLGAGAGFALAVVMLAAIRTRLAYADLPAGLRGLGMTFILAGLMSLGFSAFAQLVVLS